MRARTDVGHGVVRRGSGLRIEREGKETAVGGLAPLQISIQRVGNKYL